MEDLAWPLVVVIITVIFMIVFRKPISDLIRGIRKVTRKGIEAGDDQTQTHIPSDRAVDDLMKAFDSVVITSNEQLVYDDLKKRGLDTGGDTVKVLVRHLASTQVQLHLEVILSGIWQSQVRILEILNNAGPSLTDEFLLRVYKEAAKKYPATYENYSFKAYLEHLIRSRLVIQDGDGYSITDLGVELLLYVVRTGRRPVRPF